MHARAPAARHEVLVTGNNLKLRDDFLGISTVALVEAGGRRLLFDAGGPTTRMSLIRALRERGIGHGEIDAVFLTHLHFDHCYNLDLFPGARVIVPSRELAYAADPNPADPFVPDWILDRLARRGVEEVDGEGVLAPGVEVFPAPGHTPGLHALRLRTAEGTVVLAGDAIKYPKEVMTRACDLAFDTIEAGTATIARILDMVDEGERVVPGHFPTLTRARHGFTWDTAAEFTLLVR